MDLHRLALGDVGGDLHGLKTVADENRTRLKHRNAHRGIAAGDDADSAVKLVDDHAAVRADVVHVDGVHTAAAHDGAAGDGHAVKMDLALADALGNDEVAVDGHVAELRARAANDHIAVHSAAGALAFAHELAERAVKNGDRLGAGDRVGGTEHAVRALKELLRRHRAHCVSRPRGDLPAVGELRHRAAALKTESTAEQHSGLLSGDGVGGAHRAVAAEHHAHSVGLKHRVRVKGFAKV